MDIQALAVETFRITFCYIFFFKVYCEGRRDFNSSFKVDTQVVEAVSSRHTVIKKQVLRPGTKYSVYVKATTIEGEGVGSDPVVVETPSEGMLEDLS